MSRSFMDVNEFAYMLKNHAEKGKKHVVVWWVGEDDRMVCKLEPVEFLNVVRCRDCKFYNNHGERDVVFDEDACHWNADEQPNPDDFCSAGERREDGGTCG